MYVGRGKNKAIQLECTWSIDRVQAMVHKIETVLDPKWEEMPRRKKREHQHVAAVVDKAILSEHSENE